MVDDLFQRKVEKYFLAVFDHRKQGLFLLVLRQMQSDLIVSCQDITYFWIIPIARLKV